MNSQRPIANAIYRSRSAVRVSGTGKTETLVRLRPSIPKAGQHPSSEIGRIPCLHIERPYHRASAKELVHAIFRALDEQLPEAGYTRNYVQTRRATVDYLMNTAARLLHTHRVGLLVIDETQNMLGPRHLRPSPPPSPNVEASHGETRLHRAKWPGSDGDWETLLRQFSL